MHRNGSNVTAVVGFLLLWVWKRARVAAVHRRPYLPSAEGCGWEKKKPDGLEAAHLLSTPQGHHADWT